MTGPAPQSPKLLALTSDVYRTSVLTSHAREREVLANEKLPNGLDYPTSTAKNKLESNVFRGIEWAPDGTSLITTSEDNCLRTFIVPPDLLEEHEQPIHLQPYCVTPHPSTLYCHAVYPFFSLSSLATTVSLTAHPSHPIQLRSLLTSAIHASYPIIHAPTEQYLIPHSLVWWESGAKFVAGMDGAISVFDVEKGTERTMKTETKGIISAMALKNEVLAVGSFRRWVGIYAGSGTGNVVDYLTLPGEGSGVTSVKWDNRGVNLYVAERKSDVIHVYDVRNTGKCCMTLNGRRARGNQRLGIDEYDGTVYGGGDDGLVRLWRGGQEAMSWTVSDDAVGGVAVHTMGNVIATCSGTRKLSIEDDDGGGSLEIMDNCVKIWMLEDQSSVLYSEN